MHGRYSAMLQSLPRPFGSHRPALSPPPACPGPTLSSLPQDAAGIQIAAPLRSGCYSILQAAATQEQQEVSQLPLPTWHFLFIQFPFPCFSSHNVEFQTLTSRRIEPHLLCHVTLLYCHIHPKAKPTPKNGSMSLCHSLNFLARAEYPPPRTYHR